MPRMKTSARGGGGGGRRRSVAFRDDDSDGASDASGSSAWGAAAAAGDFNAAARAAVPVDDEDLEIVAGGASGVKRKRARGGASGSAPRARKAGRSSAAASAADAPSASAFISEIGARYTTQDDTALPMSSVAQRESSLDLSYFEQTAHPGRASKSTLADIPKLSEDECTRILASLPPRHAPQMARLHDHHASCMRKWFLWQSAGAFNLLCYGYGSKKTLLNEYARVWLTDAPVIVMHGYAPGANVKTLLNCVTRDLMDLPLQTFRDLPAHVEFIRDWFRRDALMSRGGGRRGLRAIQAQGRAGRDMEEEVWSEDEEHKEEAAAAANSAAGISYAAAAASASGSAAGSAALLPRVYIVLHNIDGASLRTDAQQAALASLCSIPQIRLVCSIDHIRAGWMWPPSLLTSFNFVGIDATTYVDYTLEHAANSVAGGTGGGGAAGVGGEASGGAGGGLVESQLAGRAAGIANVLASLTVNHRRALDKLAHIQLDPTNPDTSNMLLPSSVRSGMPLVVLSLFEDSCVEDMLVGSSANLQRLLSELRDHGLVALRTVDRTKVLHIPYAGAVIRRHVLGEDVADEAVVAAQAVQAAEEEQARSKRKERARNAFARAAGDDEEDEGDEAVDGAEDEVIAAELDAAEDAEEDF